VRPGIVLYGASPSGEWQDVAGSGIKPVMSLTSQIIAVQTLRAGDCVGYGSRYRAHRSSALASSPAVMLTVTRVARTGTPVLVDGIRTGTVGAISMDMLTVDLTPCPQAGIGTPVELWGNEIKIDEVAACGRDGGL
jgi:alanine racemase